MFIIYTLFLQASQQNIFFPPEILTIQDLINFDPNAPKKEEDPNMDVSYNCDYFQTSEECSKSAMNQFFSTNETHLFASFSQIYHCSHTTDDQNCIDLRFLLESAKANETSETFIDHDQSNTIMANLSRSHRYYYGIEVNQSYEKALAEIYEIGIYSFRKYIFDYFPCIHKMTEFKSEPKSTKSRKILYHYEYQYLENIPPTNDSINCFFCDIRHPKIAMLFEDIIHRNVTNDTEVYQALINYRFKHKGTPNDVISVCEQFLNTSLLAQRIFSFDIVFQHLHQKLNDTEKLTTALNFIENNSYADEKTAELLIYLQLTSIPPFELNITQVNDLIKYWNATFQPEVRDFFSALLSLQNIQKITKKHEVKFIRKFIDSTLFIDEVQHAEELVSFSDYSLPKRIYLRLAFMGNKAAMWNDYIIMKQNQDTNLNIMNLMLHSNFVRRIYDIIQFEPDRKRKNKLIETYAKRNPYIAFDKFWENMNNMSCAMEHLDDLLRLRPKDAFLVSLMRSYAYAYHVLSNLNVKSLLEMPHFKEVLLLVFTFAVISLFVMIRVKSFCE